MKVQELIDILSEQDPEAEVLLMCQSKYPFEYFIDGVTVRSEFTDPTIGDNQDLNPDDVFLCEGRQIRYGSRAAWDNLT